MAKEVASQLGLSPRLRGNRHRQRQPIAAARSIPALAGEPAIPVNTLLAVTVYPRACGGTADSHIVTIPSSGLSPRLRGNHLRQKLNPRNKRSIPALAGEPASLLSKWDRYPVYPRACGGTPRKLRKKHIAVGLSPRLRGNLLQRGQLAICGGSIPALAGEPQHLGDTRSLIRVYPRACGGTPSSRCRQNLPSGLSPRLRGTLLAARPDAVESGLSPRLRGNLK